MITEYSSSNKYQLTIESIPTGPGTWYYTLGKVYCDDKLIAEIKRNYSEFPFLFIENHSNNHDYLIAGEDYQGQTIIELDSGKRKDFLPEEAKKGYGFCWVEYKFDEKSQLLIVCGCFWACPYEFRFYDFSDPLNFAELQYDEFICDDERWPKIENNKITCYQSSDEDESEVLSYSIFERQGNELFLLEGWVSEKEKITRENNRIGRENWDKKIRKFKEEDPLYLCYLNLIKNSIFSSKDDYESIGITYSGWAPEFEKEENRFCRRIYQKDNLTINLEWAMETGPIKLIIFVDGKHKEDKFFEHSVQGMRECFVCAQSWISMSLVNER